MTKTFFTSDTHFGHANVIKYTNRPFSSLEEMNTEMVRRWNAVVSKGDTVVHMGDFAFGKPDFWHHILDQLNGNIVLVQGNHDVKALKEESIRKRFAEIHKYLEWVIDGQSIIMQHYPILEWNRCHRGAFMLHGHCHGSRDADNLQCRRTDVGVDSLGKTTYAPLPWEVVREATIWKPILGHHDL